MNSCIRTQKEKSDRCISGLQNMGGMGTYNNRKWDTFYDGMQQKLTLFIGHDMYYCESMSTKQSMGGTIGAPGEVHVRR